MHDLMIQPDPRVRENILTLESNLKAFNKERGLAEPECPLVHLFAPGVYGRQITIPKDTLLVGKIHRHAHLNFLMKGTVTVATEEGPVQMEGPRMLVSKAGTKRVVYTHEETVWATVHLTHETDLEAIEEEIIAPSYAVYDALGDPDVHQLLPCLHRQEVSV